MVFQHDRNVTKIFLRKNVFIGLEIFDCFLMRISKISGMHTNSDLLLEIRNLQIVFQKNAQKLCLVDKISFGIKQGERLAIVGESGSGKTLTALGIMGLLPEKEGWKMTGEMYFLNQSLMTLPDDRRRKINGLQMGMIFQEPASSLNPLMACGKQISEIFTVRCGWPSAKAKKGTLQLLSEMGFKDPQNIAQAYPHELSGGMRQRVALAMAIAARPKLIIADEPLSMLDIESRRFIAEYLFAQPARSNAGLILITHQIKDVQAADRLLVIYASRPAEYAPASRLFQNPIHPYTRLLFSLNNQNEKRRLNEIPGQMISPSYYFEGCHFAERCPFVLSVCKKQIPPWVEIDPGHFSACWLNQSSHALPNQ